MSKRVQLLLIIERQVGLYLLKKALGINGVDVVAVVTDMSVDKSKWWEGELIQDICYEKGIAVYDSTKPDQSLRELMQNISPPDVSIAALNNKFRSKSFLDWVKGKSINIHGAPLPAYQGNNCTHFAILNDAKEFGVTAYFTTETIDAGPIIAKKMFEVPSYCTNIELYRITVQAAKKLIDEKILDMLNGRMQVLEDFDFSNAVFYNTIADRQLNLNMNKDEFDNKVRAFYFPPFEPGHLLHADKKYYVLPDSLTG